MMQKEFTGRKMAAILVAGFGVVVAVNFTMAAIASGSFSGVVVENSYVASQNYNGWLDRARAQEALGWSATMARAPDGRLTIATGGVPASATVDAMLRRPMGDSTVTHLALRPRGDGAYASADPLPAGRWIVRLTVSAHGDEWKSEGEVD